MEEQGRIENLLMCAPEREFKNGLKKQGLFQEELAQYGVSSGKLKKLVRKNKIKMGYVTFQQGMKVFYTLEDVD
jgi:hypothetical protein